MSVKQRIHIIVTGRVQGVFFRDFTQRKAINLGLKGWVRNIPNHRVEIIAEGDKDKLLALFKLVKIGPEHSQVDNCKIEWQDFTGEFKDFDIVYTI